MIKFVKLKNTTDSNGDLTFSYKIPGTFGGIVPYLTGYQGREIKSIEMFFGNPTSGDCIRSLSAQDTDGVIPAPFRAAFPLYPIIKTWDESGMTSSQVGLYLFPNEKRVMEPLTNVVCIPSGTYLVITVKKASAVIDDFFINALWDDLL